ncbi:MAG: malectin domain-containing carbohydrate-binding protein [Candidatus Pedobacter colombiensis]|uniref:Malectin domain-containing carbohydrate-binding protein n=1 Tax=Candidatus Pedobacter colombiensis TaxID=3121371 RepID=A0AAJ5W524_9SPHI|nr:malectin domain-containing carbohydrate-binding protein [Pedobacter sp.]WEK17720.1 MAG: malectin domain-containing carbohydrate-binding protein [Pedobacter sp.]
MEIWRNYKRKLIVFLVGILLTSTGFTQTGLRKNTTLNSNWQSIANDININAYNGFEQSNFNDKSWKRVNVPHNWDQYEGYRRLLHGNRHGYAWYRKTFTTTAQKTGKRFFLYFEGVGSYASIWLNGKKVGYHAGGRTTFTLDVTNVIKLNNQSNLLAVRADHPVNIQDLPWVDGGCSTERGFSEGSQPMGIFRPVHLVVTSDVRIEPFGVHIWNDNKVSEKSAMLKMETEIKNYGTTPRTIEVINQLFDKDGKKISESKNVNKLLAGRSLTVVQQTADLKGVKLWSLENPYLYTLKTSIIEGNKVIDELSTPYGIRWISWPIGDHPADDKRFLLNGKPVFINGVAEYEHLIGNSHAFSAEQIRSRVMQIKAAGFNAFRDAHQPHNLLYQEYWDKLGILSWTQMAAHIWYDTPEFRANFKLLLTDWVKERRNSPSVVLWGLENESTLPEDFAKECTELIRKLDPTASAQRKVTTCNGGKGTDWDVPQNWTGTYGGDPLTYADDIQRQVLIGEYGAWRTLDLHTEGPFMQKGTYSENNMTQLMETKVRLAESVKDKTAGHYFWLFNSHDNPGRVQGGEGLRELDRVGPINYKGMFTPWEEPLDVFYMFRANYAPKQTEPMVYIVSHTWPKRWLKPGKKDSITVYSNCDEVELFNDVNEASLGKRKRGGIGTHFQWDGVIVQYNVLYAVGYVNGKAVAKDYIVLNNLPVAPHFNEFNKDAKNITVPAKDYTYLYRINCGGPEYKDQNGQLWSADRQLINGGFGSRSWTTSFPGMPAFFASQRRTFDPIKGTIDWKLFQTFRYGRDQLTYHFPVPDGEYLIELYFIEPWLGTGGGMNAKGMRLFDVAVNGQTLLKDVDIWAEVGHDAVLKKTVKAWVKGGQLIVSFPQVKSGQAVISAIAIASTTKNITPVRESNSIIELAGGSGFRSSTWMDLGDQQYADDPVYFTSLPSALYGAEWIQTSNKTNAALQFKVTADADVYVAVDTLVINRPAWLANFEDTKTTLHNSREQTFNIYKKRYLKDETLKLDGKYTIAVLPLSNMQPAYDLKTVTTYKATDANLIGNGLIKEELMDKVRVTFKKPSGDVLEWHITVGVADTYSLTLKYHNPFERSLKGKMEVLTMDGAVLKAAEHIEFTPTKKGKWNYFNTNTGTMINAGTYKVRLIAEDAAGLSMDGLDVQ